MKYDALVFIGRFSPLHCGHESVIKKALTLSDKLIVLVGSSHEARNIRNPWTFDERKEMIKIAFPTNKVIVKPLLDYPYDDNKWIAAVRSSVTTSLPWSDMPPKIGLIGHNKDHTSFYLKMFPDWDSVEAPNHKNIHATDIREEMLSQTFTFNPELISSINADYAMNCLWDNPKILDEYRLIEQYKSAWEIAPNPPTFVTVDTVVVQSGHVLLVKRKSAPGMGLWALPGGFLDQNETLVDGAIRELKEETKIKVPVPVLNGSIEGYKICDAPNRSTRGRTISIAYFINLEGNTTLPKVTGADDAEKAVWVPLNEVNRQKMFEDHFHIIDYFTGIG